MVDEVIIEVGQYGRWELMHTAENLQFLKAIARAVIAGHVTEVPRRWGGGTTYVHLDDGATAHSVMS